MFRPISTRKCRLYSHDSGCLGNIQTALLDKSWIKCVITVRERSISSSRTEANFCDKRCSESLMLADWDSRSRSQENLCWNTSRDWVCDSDLPDTCHRASVSKLSCEALSILYRHVRPWFWLHMDHGVMFTTRSLMLRFRDMITNYWKLSYLPLPLPNQVNLILQEGRILRESAYRNWA
ncbi:hypothetical protein J6590_103115 [Homalodisca vitripennis]|nr:hypothetical protein J6590_103115 [Homalodisca vitripennis]